MKTQYTKAYRSKGYVALVTVLMIGAVTSAVAIASVLAGLGTSRTSSELSDSQQATVSAETCTEYAMLKLKKDLSYSGNESLVVEKITCRILPIEGTGNNNRTIKTEGLHNNNTSRIQVVLRKINPRTQIESWIEVPNF
jgi:Tfp pilus assembly protein PilX